MAEGGEKREDEEGWGEEGEGEEGGGGRGDFDELSINYSSLEMMSGARDSLRCCV